MVSPQLKQHPLEQALEPLAQQAEWLVIVGIGEPSLIEAACACPGPVLAVLPHPTSLERLEEQWIGPWPPQLQLAELLLGAAPGECAWFHFNDGRLNGTTPLEQLQPSHPNLKLERVELRRQSTLAQLLDRWEPAEDDGGMLVVAESCAALLMPAGASLQQLQSLALIPQARTGSASGLASWDGDDADHQLSAELDRCLQQSWLVRRLSPQPEPEQGPEALIWQRDIQLRFRTTILAERDALIAERDGLQAERDGLLSEHDQRITERNQLQAERDALQGERDAISSERDALIGERDGLQAERDELQANLAAREGQLNRINQELDEILHLIDTAEQSTTPEVTSAPAQPSEAQ